MKEAKLLKILCSLPIILVTLYFIPFLGVILIITRYFIYRNKYYNLPIYLLVFGVILVIPKIVNSFISIKELKNIVDSTEYIKLFEYSKLLITLGVIFLIVSYFAKKLFDKLSTAAINYMKNDLKKDYEIRKENDLKMQEKREKAKNTHVVSCPNCGADNMLTEQTGVCKYCRSKLEYKNK